MQEAKLKLRLFLLRRDELKERGADECASEYA
jgi:hypothetical protein